MVYHMELEALKLVPHMVLRLSIRNNNMAVQILDMRINIKEVLMVKLLLLVALAVRYKNITDAIIDIIAIRLLK